MSSTFCHHGATETRTDADVIKARDWERRNRNEEKFVEREKKRQEKFVMRASSYQNEECMDRRKIINELGKREKKAREDERSAHEGAKNSSVDP